MQSTKRCNKLNQITMTKLKLVQDYYGNQGYGKRAFWIYEDGVSTHNFIFFNELEEWLECNRSKDKQIEIEYADGNLRIYNN